MEDKKIKEIINTIKDSLKSYPDLKIDISFLKDNACGTKVEISLIELEELKRLEDRNILISKRYGFTQNIIGMEFESKGLKYKVVDFKTNNRKYPVIATQLPSGLSYKFSAQSVKKCLGGDKLINRNCNLEKLLGNE